MIIAEYCRFGNLQNYLNTNRNCRNSFVNQVDEFGNMKIDMTTVNETDDSPVIQQEAATSSDGYLVPNTDGCETFSSKDLVSWSFQIARGMGYLSSKKVLTLVSTNAE